MQDNGAAFEFVRPKHLVNDIGRIFCAALLHLQLQDAFSFGRLHFEPGANERAALAGGGNVSASSAADIGDAAGSCAKMNEVQ